MTHNQPHEAVTSRFVHASQNSFMRKVDAPSKLFPSTHLQNDHSEVNKGASCE
jgi:hypothetical protein